MVDGVINVNFGSSFTLTLLIVNPNASSENINSDSCCQHVKTVFSFLSSLSVSMLLFLLSSSSSLPLHAICRTSSELNYTRSSHMHYKNVVMMLVEDDLMRDVSEFVSIHHRHESFLMSRRWLRVHPHGKRRLNHHLSTPSETTSHLLTDFQYIRKQFLMFENCLKGISNPGGRIFFPVTIFLVQSFVLRKDISVIFHTRLLSTFELENFLLKN